MNLRISFCLFLILSTGCSNDPEATFEQSKVAFHKAYPIKIKDGHKFRFDREIPKVEGFGPFHITREITVSSVAQEFHISHYADQKHTATVIIQVNDPGYPRDGELRGVGQRDARYTYSFWYDTATASWSLGDVYREASRKTYTTDVPSVDSILKRLKAGRYNPETTEPETKEPRRKGITIFSVGHVFDSDFRRGWPELEKEVFGRQVSPEPNAAE